MAMNILGKIQEIKKTVVSTVATVPKAVSEFAAGGNGGSSEKTITDIFFNVVKDGDYATLRRFLENEGYDVNTKHKKYYGWTALHYAAEADNEEMIYYLLHQGANPTIQAMDGSTPLQWAIERKKTRAIQALNPEHVAEPLPAVIATVTELISSLAAPLEQVIQRGKAADGYNEVASGNTPGMEPPSGAELEPEQEGAAAGDTAEADGADYYGDIPVPQPFDSGEARAEMPPEYLPPESATAVTPEIEETPAVQQPQTNQEEAVQAVRTKVFNDDDFDAFISECETTTLTTAVVPIEVPEGNLDKWLDEELEL
eukprot:TRINITY_DN93017_c0_g1_i1.p1 TRINITY_DN93017_c0_g1~~TRINITY_DN93017_c0_g1_i1.p1  ORF type:complete len:313 (+),score=75.90 TRINITY_DN93017_c0_g1_i1:1234-2172(+)